MRRFVSAGLALSAITLSLAATNVAQAQTVANSSFETPSVSGAPGGFSYNTAGASWTFSGLTGIASNGSFFTTTQVAPLGTQVAILQQTGSFSQSITGFTAGGTYSVSFSAAQRLGGGPPTSTTQGVNVTLGGFNLGTTTPTGTTYSTYTTLVSGGLLSGTNTLTFAGTSQSDQTVFIDNVVITRVGTAAPEPGSALLLVPGLLGLVGVVRRRRK